MTKKNKCQTYAENFWLSIAAILMFTGAISLIVIGVKWNVARIEASEVAEERLETIERELQYLKKYDERSTKNYGEIRDVVRKIESNYCIDVTGGSEYYGGKCHPKN